MKQGCIVAPLLFIFNINSIVETLMNLDFHPPTIVKRPIPMLFYADGTANLSYTKVGLRRALCALSTYFNEGHLSFNKIK